MENEQVELIFSKKDLWFSQAPAFNFELDADELLQEALKRGFVTQVGDDRYAVNTGYGEGV